MNVGHLFSLSKLSKEKKMTTVRTYRLNDIVNAMKNRTYMGIVDGSGNCHVGLVNGLQPEDGSGKNWIVTICNRTNKYSKVFIHAS
jgi:hypothetical protein